MDWLIAQQLLVSLSLGLLVGLQRERSKSAIAGIRTFPLITLLGTVCGQLARVHSGWVVVAGLLALGALLAVTQAGRLKGDTGETGLTTEIAVLLLYALGVFIASGPILIAVVLGGVIALLLYLKPLLHRFVGRLGETDMRAIMQFVFVSMVVLPVLPNESYGPYQVLNPFEVWMMVVLIVGLSLAGYVAYKILGGAGGLLVAGMLGGVISSTATSVSAARQARDQNTLVGMASLIIMIASTVTIVRVLIEIGVVAPRNFTGLAGPLVAMLAAMVVIGVVAYFAWRKEAGVRPTQHNPAELKTALVFAVIYGLIKLAVAAGRDQFGEPGLYAVSVISGLTDMDAVTLSTSRLVDSGKLEPTLGWRTILIAAMSNLVFKAAAVAVVGGAAIFYRVAMLFALSGVAGGLILALWR
ncbi:MAG TPA: DUF4010 domain-containing protein [Chthoniobacterales bacterium]|nr:DUF4010 domain-containing protein [Chthoniobacterales bacterium]